MTKEQAEKNITSLLLLLHRMEATNVPFNAVFEIALGDVPTLGLTGNGAGYEACCADPFGPNALYDIWYRKSGAEPKLLGSNLSKKTAATFLVQKYADSKAARVMLRHLAENGRANWEHILQQCYKPQGV